MFTLVSGPFSPHLESALVETVQQIKSADSRRRWPFLCLLNHCEGGSSGYCALIIPVAASISMF